jgi:hypothetical protein
VTDTLLRGSSPYSHAATFPFKEKPIDYKKRWPAIFVASICISISTVLLAHALVKRAPWKSKKPAAGTAGTLPDTVPVTVSSIEPSTVPSATPSFIFSEGYGLINAPQTPGQGTPGAVTPGTSTPGGYFSRPVSSYARASFTSLPRGSDSISTLPTPNGISIRRTANQGNVVCSSLEITPVHDKKQASAFVEFIDEKELPQVTVNEISLSSSATSKLPKATMEQVGVSKGAIVGAKGPIAAPKARVDYLAGLVGISHHP